MSINNEYNLLAADSLIPTEREVAIVLRELEDECLLINGDVYSREYEDALADTRNPEVEAILRDIRLEAEDRESIEANRRVLRRAIGAGVMVAASLPLVIAGGLVCPPLLVAAGAAFIGGNIQGYTLD